MIFNPIITYFSQFNLLKKRSTSFWFYLSLLIPLYFGLMSLTFYLTHPYLIQDDARHHVVWLQKFMDQQLFPQDLIANYFYGVAPLGYKFLYWIMAQIGISPISFAKIIPTFLAFITTIYIFKVSLEIFPRPEAAFLGVLILNENLWMNDDLISATPRAFLYPIFAGFLFYLTKRSLFPCLITIALLGLFFPQFLFIALAMLTVQLFEFTRRSPHFSKTKENYIVWGLGIAISAILLAIFAVQVSRFGEVMSVDQMKTMPEFGLNGRVEYFGVNPLYFILDGNSGLNLPLYPFPILLSFALPFVMRSHFPTIQQITPKIKILLTLIISSLGLFLLAHIFLFKLYFPSRYTYHSFIFIMAITSGIILFTLLNYSRKLDPKNPPLIRGVWGNTGIKIPAKLILKPAKILLVISLFLPFIPIVPFIFQGWVIGQYPELYQFFATQPKQSLIASLADETDNLPAFSHRSVLVSREFALPHHVEYYQEIEQRTIDLIQAQYSSDVNTLKAFINQYKINYLLLESNFKNPNYLLEKPWLIQSSFQNVVFETINKLKQSQTLAILQFIEPCSVFKNSQLNVLDTSCILPISPSKIQN